MEDRENIHPHFVTRQGEFDNEYFQWIADVKQRFRSSQAKAAVRVNGAMLEFYWNLGRDIVAMQAETKWGNGFFNNLSLDLRQEFHEQKGFSVTNLKYTKRWYLFYFERITNHQKINDEIRQKDFDEIASLFHCHYDASENKNVTIRHQLGDELIMPECFSLIPWRQHVEIIVNCKTIKEAIFYVRQSIENNWGRTTLIEKIHQNDYATHGKAITNFTEQLPAQQVDQAQAILKDPYHFGFLRLKEKYNEQDLEDALVHNITHFLLELGQGFSFVGRQMELRMPGGQSFFPDLVFYHYRQKRFIVLELKTGEFIPEYAGKINFYVNAADNLLKGDDDNASVGLLICRSAKKAIVEWSFHGMTNPIGVATYELEQVVNRTVEDFEKRLDDKTKSE